MWWAQEARLTLMDKTQRLSALPPQVVVMAVDLMEVLATVVAAAVAVQMQGLRLRACLLLARVQVCRGKETMAVMVGCKAVTLLAAAAAALVPQAVPQPLTKAVWAVQV